jgi:diguanylate cyclase (GGDEF)-like protein
MERAVHRLTYADELTGLASRRQILVSLGSLSMVRRPVGAVLVIGVEQSMSVNSHSGTDIADAVLIEVARRLRVSAPESTTVGRLSADVFAVVTHAAPVTAYALATRLVTVLADPVVLPDLTVHLTASVGLAELSGSTGGSGASAVAEDVLRRADLALRRARQLGRGRVEWYDAAVEQAMLRRLELEGELPGALERGELELIYQPVLDLVAGRPLAVEALLRWRHPRLGTLLPGDLIPVAEDLALIEPIGAWAMGEATRQLAVWLKEGRDISMSVNVSAHELDGRFAQHVVDTLQRGQIPADRLVLEFAELGLSADTFEVGRYLGELRCHGVRTALDDFGTAPDSLHHLRQLPMDMVKIGPSFFDPAAIGPGFGAHNWPIVDVMVGLGRRLGIEVVAQGLESREQLDVVREAGCRLGQGHLFSRPLPAEHVEAYLDGFPAR